MAEEISEGDWIKYRSSGLVQRGKVIRIDDEGYFVQPDGLTTGGTLLAKDADVEKIAPPEKES